MIFWMKGEILSGRGAGSLSIISFSVSYLLSASNGSWPENN
jgi:hypothetical protein